MPSERVRLINLFDHACDGWGMGDGTIHRMKAFEICADVCLADRKRILDAVEKPLREMKKIFINPMWGTCLYMEGTQVYEDLKNGNVAANEALSIIEKERI